MNSQRKSFMTLCFRGNTEVTHKVNENGVIEVMFEEAVNSGFNTLVIDIDGNIISNVGFNASDVDFFLRFIKGSRNVIIQESRGEL